MSVMRAGKLGVAFADVVGTGRLVEKLGAVEAGYAVDRATKRMERAAALFGGEILHGAADQWIAVFASADAALDAALEMQRRVADLLPVSGVKMSIRIGVHWGEGDRRTDVRRIEAVEVARRLLTLAGSGEILTCGRTAEVLDKPLQQILWSRQDLRLSLANGEELPIYSAQWALDDDAMQQQMRETVALPLPAGEPVTLVPADAVAPQSDSLRVRAGGKAYLIDERTPQLTIGRDRKLNDIVLKDAKASRQHARIERRPDGRCVLVDLSTNGTFVLDGTVETRVRGGELLLGARGRIAFGHSPRDQGAECVDFEHV